MKKLKFLFKLKLWTVSLVLFLSGNISAQPDTLSFLRITDTYVISDLGFYHTGIEGDRKHYGLGNEPLKHFLHATPEKTNCDFVDITGDLIDFFEAQTGDGKMLDFQADQFVRLTDGSPVPVFATLGNHDIEAYSWPEIIFMHIPVVPANSGDEPACELYSVLAKYSSSRMILAGHNHKNAIRGFYSPGNNRITQLQTGALGPSVENWRMICLTENNMLVSFPGKTDTEIEIPID